MGYKMCSKFEQINIFDFMEDNNNESEDNDYNLNQLNAINLIKEKENVVNIKINKLKIVTVTTEGDYEDTIIPQGNILNKFTTYWKNNDYLINPDGEIICIHPYNYIR